MKKWNEPVAVYATDPQLALLQSPAKRKVFIAGRGSGKTHYAGFEVWQIMRELPRSKGAIVGLTYQQILNNFLPPMLDAWRSLGLRDGVHYVVHKAPPREWARPYKPFKDYENVLSLWNGCAIAFASVDRKNTKRGGNFDWLLFDEAVLLNKEMHDKELVPTVRGNEHRYTSPRHQSLIYCSSQSWLPSGRWVPDLRAEVDVNDPTGTAFQESTAADNAAVGGQAYIERMRKLLPLVVFNVEVLNQGVEQIPDCFYEEFNQERHTYYDSNDYDYGDNFALQTANRYYDKTLPIAFSFDFGGSICCATVHQDVRGRDRSINCFYRKRELGTVQNRSLISLLVDDIGETYRGHTGMVEVYGDRNGNSRQANSTQTFYEEISEMLRKKGFFVVLRVQPGELDAAHGTKHFILNRLLSEQDASLPKIGIDLNRCKALIISMQNAAVTLDLKKDKSSEDPRKGIPQEHATHLSDCFDNYYGKKYASKFGAKGAGEAWFGVGR